MLEARLASVGGLTERRKRLAAEAQTAGTALACGRLPLWRSRPRALRRHLAKDGHGTGASALPSRTLCTRLGPLPPATDYRATTTRTAAFRFCRRMSAGDQCTNYAARGIVRLPRAEPELPAGHGGEWAATAGCARLVKVKTHNPGVARGRVGRVARSGWLSRTTSPWSRRSDDSTSPSFISSDIGGQLNDYAGTRIWATRSHDGWQTGRATSPLPAPAAASDVVLQPLDRHGQRALLADLGRPQRKPGSAGAKIPLRR